MRVIQIRLVVLLLTCIIITRTRKEICYHLQIKYRRIKWSLAKYCNDISNGFPDKWTNYSKNGQTWPCIRRWNWKIEFDRMKPCYTKPIIPTTLTGPCTFIPMVGDRACPLHKRHTPCKSCRSTSCDCHKYRQIGPISLAYQSSVSLDLIGTIVLSFET